MSESVSCSIRRSSPASQRILLRTTQSKRNQKRTGVTPGFPHRFNSFACKTSVCINLWPVATTRKRGYLQDPLLGAKRSEGIRGLFLEDLRPSQPTSLSIRESFLRLKTPSPFIYILNHVQFEHGQRSR